MQGHRLGNFRGLLPSGFLHLHIIVLHPAEQLWFIILRRMSGAEVYCITVENLISVLEEVFPVPERYLL